MPNKYLYTISVKNFPIYNKTFEQEFISFSSQDFNIVAESVERCIDWVKKHRYDFLERFPNLRNDENEKSHPLIINECLKGKFIHAFPTNEPQTNTLA